MSSWFVPMLEALIGALNEQVNRHVKEYHSFNGNKPEGELDGEPEN